MFIVTFIFLLFLTYFDIKYQIRLKINISSYGILIIIF